ncbi:hypothetical protein U9M48_005452 [Paspalum notatum var. saurae]|uniref:Uncharacterized protein n=1 Tax=Paspalum notatum var. saurae TaxID=547442 RepID=A0AAQ3SLE5_PASNO
MDEEGRCRIQGRRREGATDARFGCQRRHEAGGAVEVRLTGGAWPQRPRLQVAPSPVIPRPSPASLSRPPRSPEPTHASADLPRRCRSRIQYLSVKARVLGFQRPVAVAVAALIRACSTLHGRGTSSSAPIGGSPRTSVGSPEQARRREQLRPRAGGGEQEQDLHAGVVPRPAELGVVAAQDDSSGASTSGGP